MAMESLWNDPVVQLVLQLRSELNNDECLNSFLASFREVTHSRMAQDEYQKLCRSLIPEHLHPLVNQLIRAVILQVSQEREVESSSRTPPQMAMEKLVTGPKKHKRSPTPAGDTETDLSPSSCSSDSEAKGRTRQEWSVQEDKIFLQGLRDNSLDFNALLKLLPNRTRSQIRTHYRYLAKSLKINEEGTGIPRRLKTRGRPPRGRVPAPPSDLMVEIQDCIQKIENSDGRTLNRGRPPSYKYEEILALTKNSFSLNSNNNKKKKSAVPNPQTRLQTPPTPDQRVDAAVNGLFELATLADLRSKEVNPLKPQTVMIRG